MYIIRSCLEPAMPLDPRAPPADNAPTARPRPPEPDEATKQWRRETDWKTAHRAWLPYWQQQDPVPPVPDAAPEIETPGEVLTERQEAFCRLYLERPVAAKAAVAAGYSPATARQQACRLLKHPLVIRRLHELRDAGGKDWQVRRDTIIDQAEAVFEAAMEKSDYYAAMQALTMKARLAGFADYLPGVRILRRPAQDHEQEFWARAHAAEQRIMAARLGEIAGGGADLDAVRAAAAEAQSDAELHAEGAELMAKRLAIRTHDAIERRANAKR
jgi:hypothetical protein